MEVSCTAASEPKILGLSREERQKGDVSHVRIS